MCHALNLKHVSMTDAEQRAYRAEYEAEASRRAQQMIAEPCPVKGTPVWYTAIQEMRAAPVVVQALEIRAEVRKAMRMHPPRKHHRHVVYAVGMMEEAKRE